MTGPASRGGGLLIAFYGDDFTGSTDALEILALAGLDPVLFLDADAAGEIELAQTCRAVGLAGVSRSKSPAWMDDHLPPAFDLLKRFGGRLNHYKVCSTFDSAPEIGSIGRALEIGSRYFPGGTVPVVVGAPDLGRYQTFGNLFARAGGSVRRLDRHPNMMRHPVTPMHEADLTVHLGRQMRGSVGLMDMTEIGFADADRIFAAKMAAGDAALFLDVFDEASTVRAGELLWEHLPDGGFVVGSSGVESAIVGHLRRRGELPPVNLPARAAPVRQLIVVSASCSPATDEQIGEAERSGFVVLTLDATRLLVPDEAEAHIAEINGRALAVMREGASVVLCTARGPDDPGLAAFAARLDAWRISAEDGGEAIGGGLGRALARLLEASDCRRVLVAGGDTSGRVVAALGLTSLTVAAPIVRGAPLCRATGRAPWAEGLEIVLKGGQVGGPHFFSAVRDGKGVAR